MDFRLNSSRSANLLILAAALLIAVAVQLYPDKIFTAGNVQGDSLFYTKLATSFPQMIGEIPSHFAQRILPSALIYGIIRIFSIPPTVANAALLFGILNIVMLCLIAYLWCAIADEIRIRPYGKWLGFFAFFINYAILKEASYIPVILDVSGYALGTLLFFFYFKRQSAGIFITMAIGLFTWPTVFFQGLPLLFFPRQREIPPPPAAAETPKPDRRATVAAVLISAAIWWKLIDLVHQNFYVLIPPFLPAINLSIIIVGIYLFFAYKSLLAYGPLYESRFYLSPLRSLRTWGYVFLLAGLVIGAKLAQNTLSHGKSPISSEMIGLFINILFSNSVIYPGVFITAHLVYFGPVLILTIFLWKKIVSLIHQYGPGLTLSAAGYILLCLSSESRCLIAIYPFFAIVTVKAAESLDWQPKHYWLIFVISALLSKFWLHIGPLNSFGPPHPSALERPDMYPAGSSVPLIHFNIDWALTLPGKLFCMNRGPYMSADMYIAQSAILLLIVFFLYTRLNFRTNRPADRS